MEALAASAEALQAGGLVRRRDQPERRRQDKGRLDPHLLSGGGIPPRSEGARPSAPRPPSPAARALAWAGRPPAPRVHGAEGGRGAVRYGKSILPRDSAPRQQQQRTHVHSGDHGHGRLQGEVFRGVAVGGLPAWEQQGRRDGGQRWAGGRAWFGELGRIWRRRPGGGFRLGKCNRWLWFHGRGHGRVRFHVGSSPLRCRREQHRLRESGHDGRVRGHDSE